jgi:hypothetical protein
MNKIDIKSIIIGLLVLIIILVIIFGKKTYIDKKDDEINQIKTTNANLVKKNDSLHILNKSLDLKIDTIYKKIELNKIILNKNNSEIINLKNKKNETNSYITNLSGNDVASEMSKYINRHEKSTLHNK